MTIQPFVNDVTGVTGLIAMYSGLLANLPPGWMLCDGNNGTPDLRGKMVKSVSNMSAQPGSTGGQESYTLTESQLPSHQHALNTGNAGDHSHTFYEDDEGDTYYQNGMSYHEPGSDTTTSKGGSHDHSVTISSTGGGTAVDNMPPYYEVAFVMKS